MPRRPEKSLRRPTLSPHVSARRHIENGEVRVVLEDRRSDRFLVLGEREWQVLRCADGSRDATGIASAVDVRGLAAAGEAQVEQFLDQMGEAGLLVEGDSACEQPAASDDAPAIAEADLAARRAELADRPLRSLPGFHLDCDGRGLCCRFFRTLLFSPREALTARALCPAVLEGGDDEERLFTPERGSVLGPHGAARGVRAATLVDGRCAFLEGDGRCRLHRAGGAGAKPAACRLFPAIFVDDGETIRVSVSPECACVFRSATSGDAGALLVPEGALHGADLPPEAHVRRLPGVVRLSDALTLSRVAYVAWSDKVAETWSREDDLDAAFSLWSLAVALEKGGRLEEVTPESFADEDLRSALRVLGERAQGRRRGLEAWCAVGALAPRALESIENACERLAERGAFTREPMDRDRQDEQLYLSVLFFGHLLVDDGTVADALRNRAVCLLVARELREEEHPLALVEAAVRGYSLEG